MGSQYAGNAANYPNDYTIPDDSDPPTASAVNVGLEALGDRTANLKAQANKLDVLTWQQSALNFARRTLTGSYTYAFYNRGINAIVYCGSSGMVVETVDWGELISSTSSIASVASGEACVHGSSDTVGNTVVATSTRYLFQRTLSTNTWTKVDVSGGVPANTPVGRVAYDSVRAKWVWVDAANNVAKSSSDRTTWTSVTCPFSTASITRHRMAANPTTGTIVFIVNGSTIRVRRTTDAGVTWSAPVDLAAPMTDADSLSLCCNTDGTWILSCGDTTAKISRVYRSVDDGASWTQVSSLTTAGITHIAALGSLWVALAVPTWPSTALAAGTVEVLWSTNAGATWNRSGLIYGNTTGLFALAGGFVVTTTNFGGYTMLSHRMTAPAIGTVS